MRANSRGGMGRQPGGMSPSAGPGGVNFVYTHFQCTTLAVQTSVILKTQASKPCVGADTRSPASPAVIPLCAINGNACILQPIHGDAWTRNDARHDASSALRAAQRIRGCSSTWLCCCASAKAATAGCQQDAQHGTSSHPSLCCALVPHRCSAAPNAAPFSPTGVLLHSMLPPCLPPM